MLTVRRTTPRRVALPAALAALETTTALGLAHTAAGGEVPALGWLAAFGVVTYAAGLAVLRRRIPIGAALPALLATQLLGHAWLVALTPGGHAHHDAGPVLGLSVPMVAAHVTAAAVAGLVWALRRRAVVVILRWADEARPLVSSLRDQLGTTRRRQPAQQHLMGAAPTRGPPAALVPC